MSFLQVLQRKVRSTLERLRRFIVSQRFGFSPDKIYGQEFYDGGGFAKTRETAQKIAVFCKSNFAPDSVLDVGCGPGEYLKAFSALGINAVGCEGSANGVRRAVTSSLAFVHDLRKPLVLNKKFDLVISVEVAEHLPKSSSLTLVKSISEHANKLVVFTAAPPGCLGDDHINCQIIEYWEQLFLGYGFVLDHDTTRRLREFAAAENCAEWWKHWSFVFRK